MSKIGILGGTFDPVHFGHIHLGLNLFEKHKLDEVWFVPTKINPLKTKFPVVDAHRVAMLKLALHELPFFKINEIELQSEELLYTVNTLKKLKSLYPEHEFYLLLGDDAIQHFTKWKEPLEVVNLAAPLIGARNSAILPDLSHLPIEIADSFRAGWTDIPVLEISATNIRMRLNTKLYCGHLVPAKVLDYIAQHQLYYSLI